MRYENNFVRSVRRSLRIKKSKSVTITNNNTINKRKSDSFVNSQEWTLSRGVPDLRLGIVGSLSSGKSALVHRYLTGSYMQEESPEGGRFKKEIILDGQSYLLLIRDEGGPPELQFTAWVDAVIFVFSLENESSFNAIYTYYAKMAHYRNTAEVPLILVGTQDAISENNPRVIDDGRARKLASDLKRCTYFETCATYGLNVERVFHDACSKIVAQRLSLQGVTPTNSRPSTPTHLLRYPSTNNGYTPGQPYSTLPSSNNHQVTPPMSGSSPSHVFTNTLTKDGLNQGSGAELTAMTRGDSFRDEGFKRVSAPVGVGTPFMHPPPPPNSRTQHMDAMNTPSNRESGTNKDLATPSSTPTTTRKSRRKSNLFTPAKKAEEKDKNKNGDVSKVGSGRAIPIKQGWLYKKSNKALNKDWKKKYVTLCDDGKLTYHPSLHDYMEDVHGKEISLQYTTVKVPGMKPRGSRVVGADPLSSELNSLNLAANAANSTTGATITGRASLGGPAPSTKDKVTLTSYETFNDPTTMNGVDTASLSSKIENQTPNVKKRHRRNKSSSTKNAECEDCDGYEFSIVSLDNKQWHLEANSQEDRDDWVTAIEQRILASLQTNESNKTKMRQTHPIDPQAINILKTQVAGNMNCIDCDAPNPEWASINLGVLMCIECSGIHRNLGSHISKVRSLDLDEWPPGPLSVMLALGNEFCNSIWESRSRNNAKPTPISSREEKETWIRAKYDAKEFVSILNYNIPIQEQLVECVCRGDVRGLASLLPHAGDHINAPISPPRDLRTLLHLSSALPSLPCTQLLIWFNANPKVCDVDGRTCLYYARSTGDKEIIDLLIQNGCPNTPTPTHANNVANLSNNGMGMVINIQPSTLPRRKGSISRKPEILDKLQASVI